MTISSTASEVSYAGNGITTAFNIPFVFDTNADVYVYEQVTSTGVVTPRTTGIIITGGSGSTGTLTYSVAPPTGTTVTILDNPERTQTHDYVSNDPFPAESHEGALDKLTRLVKRLYQTSLKSLRVADGDTYTDLTLPVKASRASKFLAFDANGNPIASAAVSDGDALLRAELIAGASSLVKSTGIKYDITPTETAAGVTPVNYFYDVTDYKSVLRNGADISGVSDSTAAFQLAAKAANGSSTGVGNGGRVSVPNGTFLISKVGIGNTVFVGESVTGTIIKGYGAGTGAMLDAAIDLDGTTANTSGGGYCEKMTIDGNSTGRDGLRTYGGGCSPNHLIIKNVVNGLRMSLPIWASAKHIYVTSFTGKGVMTDAPSGDNGTSTTFEDVWCNSGATGFDISNLYYSEFINCVAQDTSVRSWNFDGSANGLSALYSLILNGCATEGTGTPFYLKNIRDLTIINPRIVSPTVGVNLITLDNCTGSVIDFSTPSALSGGAYHLDIINHAGGAGAIVISGADVTYAQDQEQYITLLGTTANGANRVVAATRMNRFQVSQSGNYTTVVSDSGCELIHPSGAGAGDTFTIAANSSVPYPIGTEILFTNRDGNSLSIAINTDMLVLAGTSTTGTRALAANSMALARKIESGLWIIGAIGGGLT